MEESKNKYLWPVEKNENIRITYDESPAHVGRLKHAVDFICPEGTPVKAAADGIVVDVEQDSDKGGEDSSFDKYGNFIEIQHENNEFTIYEHIKKNSALVKVGDKVSAGQIICHSGTTGWLSHLGPHLHFEVHRYVNEIEYETVEIQWSD